jgi:DNA modification methylase
MNYQAFLQSKFKAAGSCGFEADSVNPMLRPFQADIVRWACRKGRALVAADTGLGKTPMQLNWAELVCKHTGKPTLILTPLAVAKQTYKEGVKFRIDVTVCRSQSDCSAGVNVANYEMLKHFDPAAFGALVLDESSILKAFDGKTRKMLTDFTEGIPYRLCCTATPAPNDLVEILNHAEFLSVMRGKEIIALYFTQDGNTTHKWRLKGHARKDFWRWLASWAVAVRRPSDLGYDDAEFALPELRVNECEVSQPASPGMLFAIEANSLSERLRARRVSLDDRVEAAAKIVNATDESFLLWCNLNDESSQLADAIPGAVEVVGSDSIEKKEDALVGFTEGKFRVLITKPKIAGFGMNWQHCHNMAFVGLSDSWEQYYQAIRRCWRFGQKHPVNVHIITAETEGAVVKNIKRKEREAANMMEELVSHMKDVQLDRVQTNQTPYVEETVSGNGWTMHLGDSVEQIEKVETESCGLIVFSPPFPGMYAYTNSSRDNGNTESINQMIEHFRFLVSEGKLMRVLKPGRSCCMHLTQAVAFKGVDGYSGLKDFRGRIIDLMESEGWIYYGEVCIDKDPQVKAIRTKDAGLLFKSLANDSSKMHMALADYMLQFKKPGDNHEPIRAGVSAKYNNKNGWITPEEWIEWAAPVWYRQTKDYPGGIRETDVLNVRQARETDDERHLCPLQLGVIERAVKLWSNPGDLVFSPFAGIGSEGYQSLLLHRRFVGIELKGSYFRTACQNLGVAENKAAESERTLFDLATA